MLTRAKPFSLTVVTLLVLILVPGASIGGVYAEQSRGAQGRPTTAAPSRNQLNPLNPFNPFPKSVAGTTTRVSVASDGTKGNNVSYSSSASTATPLSQSLANSLWTPNERVNDDADTPDQKEPDIAVDEAGNAYVVWDGYPPSRIYFAYRPVGGAWIANVRFGDEIGWQQAQTAVAVDAAGNAYAVWYNIFSYDEDIYFAYRPTGGSFGTGVPVNDDTVLAHQQDSAIAVNAAGDACVVWMDLRNDPDGDCDATSCDLDIYFAYRSVGGSWGVNERVNDDTGTRDQWNPDIAIDGAGNAYAVWEDYSYPGEYFTDIYFSYRPSDGDWSPRVRVNDNPGWAHYPVITVDANGNAYAIWKDYDSHNIYFSYRPAGGNWEANEQVNDDVGIPYQGYHDIAVDGAGNVYAVWEDRRNGDSDIYFAYRPAEGSWGADERVNDGTGTAGQRDPAIAIDGSGNAYVVWQDDRNGDNDIYFSYRPGGPLCDLTKQPVLLVHGWGGPPSDVMADDEVGFAQLSKWMLADGYVEGCNLFYATGVKASNSRILNAVAIQLNLRAVYNTITALNPDWRGHFDIIGHSYGGLNARFYLESSRYLDDASYGQYGIHVDNLFTLGSPHGGAIVPVELFPGAILIGLGHLNDEEWLSANDLLAGRMNQYNLSHRQPNDVCYRLIGGNFMLQPDLLWKSPLIWRLYLSFTLIPNDVGVSRRSSLQLGTNPDLASRYGHVVTYANTDMHGYKDMLGLGEVRSYVSPTLTYDEIISPNLGANIDQCHSSQLSTRSAVDDQSEELTIPPLLIASDAITGGQTTTGTVLVDWDGQTAFYVTWMSGGDLDLTLGDPAGTVFTPTIAISDPNADYGKLMFGTSGLATYIFTNTLTGTWTYTLTAVSGPYPIPFDLYVNPDSPLVARAYAPEWQPFGAPAVITTSLFYSTTPVSGGAVQAHVTRPDGGEGSISLQDGGLPPDDAAGDGIYSGTYTDTTTGGFYYVLVEADGTYASQAYHRTAQTIFPVAADSATLSGSYADQPKDENGDGLYEYLDVSVGVNATQQGDFTVAAVLQGEGGQYIDLANTTVYSFTGVTTLTLQFDGQAIRASGLNGPYTVTEVLLLDDAMLIKLEEADDVWVTPPYDHRQFGVWSDRLYLPLILRNH